MIVEQAARQADHEGAGKRQGRPGESGEEIMLRRF